MRTVFHYAAHKDCYEIYLFPDERHYIARNDVLMERSSDGHAQPYLEIKTQLWVDLEKHILEQHSPPATERHLQDAIATRDKIATLHEMVVLRMLDSLPRWPSGGTGDTDS